MTDTNSLREKYQKQLEERLGVKLEDLKEPITSKEYQQFRKEALPPQANAYEKLCNTVEQVVTFAPKEEARAKMQKDIETSHLHVTPEGVYTTAYTIPLVLLFISVTLFLVVPTVRKLFFGAAQPLPLFLLSVSLIFSLVIIIPLLKYPHYLAASWRQKSSNQMVLAIFYISTYMRQASNLERAFEFASEHLDPPLALDFRKILWNVETERYDSLNDALDEYLKSWKDYSEEFVDAMHLIQSSLLEASDARRINLLDKSLDVMLEGTYEKMLHYAQNLKTPITTLHMLGVILPVLGLVILPLAVSFLEGIGWVQLAIIYNLFLPIAVFYLAKTILASRPSGYGDTDITEKKNVKKYAKGVSMFGMRLPSEA